MNVPTAVWNSIFLVGFIVYLGIRHEYGKRLRGVATTMDRIDRREKILLAFVTLGALLLPVLYLCTPLLAFADYRLPMIVSCIGTVAMLAALWLFWRSHADLGLNWSVTLQVRKDHQLIRHGVYRLIRHPMYASIWLWSIAQGMLLQNWLAGWCAVATFAPLYFLRTPREEQMMCEIFGKEYRDYMAQTGRIIPRFAARKNA